MEGKSSEIIPLPPPLPQTVILKDPIGQGPPGQPMEGKSLEIIDLDSHSQRPLGQQPPRQPMEGK